MPTPDDFWRTHVLPDYDDYMRDQGNERKAMHAAVSAFHMADHVWAYYHTNDPKKVFSMKSAREYCQYLATHCCPDFALIRDVAEAHKHMELDRPQSPPRRVTSSSNSHAEYIPGDPIGSFVVGSSVIGGDAIVVNLDDGSRRIFGPVLGLVRVDTIDDAIQFINSGQYGNMACLFTSSGANARKFRYEAEVGNIGINIGVAAPMAFFPFSGWKDSFFGDLHAQAHHAFEFYTQTKVVVERWPQEWTRQF